MANKEEYRFNYKKATEQQWAAFAQEVENNLNFELPDSGSYKAFNDDVEKFYKVLYSAREKHLPQTKVDPLHVNKHARGDTWFNGECRQYFKQIRRIRSYLGD